MVRALETVVDARGEVHAGSGWTDTVVTPDRPVTSVDGLLTGWHEPEASHLAMLEAIAGRTCSSAPTQAALPRGTCGTSSATCTDPAVTEHDGSTVEPPLATMPTTRRAILMALKRNGSMRAPDLAEQLGITVAAVRQQLVRLSEDGLVTHRRDPEGRGRPVPLLRARAERRRCCSPSATATSPPSCSATSAAPTAPR